MDYEFLEHTADVKFRAFGGTLEKAFENSALALKGIIYKGKVRGNKREKISLQSKGSGERLLEEFLEEFLFLFETKNFILSKVKRLEIKEKSGVYFLCCECLGDDAGNYDIETHVKAITYNEMFVRKEKDKWVCQVVVDV